MIYISRQDHILTPNTPHLTLRQSSLAITRVLLALIILGTVSVASAQAKSLLELDIRVIEAQHVKHKQKRKQKSDVKSRQVDLALKDISAKLTRNFPKYKNFKQLRRKAGFSLVRREGVFEITPKLTAELRAKVRRNGVTLATQVGRKRGITNARYGELFFQAFKWRGRVLILAVRARKS